MDIKVNMKGSYRKLDANVKISDLCIYRFMNLFVDLHLNRCLYVNVFQSAPRKEV